jgi:hypothetical protein
MISLARTIELHLYLPLTRAAKRRKTSGSSGSSDNMQLIKLFCRNGLQIAGVDGMIDEVPAAGEVRDIIRQNGDYSANEPIALNFSIVGYK